MSLKGKRTMLKKRINIVFIGLVVVFVAFFFIDLTYKEIKPDEGQFQHESPKLSTSLPTENIVTSKKW